MGVVRDTPIQHVSDTAIWVATFRAQETERPDALFRDPLARRLVGERGEEIARQMRYSKAVGWSVVIRTRIIDDYIRKAVADGVDTILNLGAGLDTRPYRMELPATLRWIEVDYPHVIAHKEERLRSETPRCRLERVPLDLADVAARQKFLAGINTSVKKALVLTEGVTPYLSNDEVSALADDLRDCDRFAYWVVDYLSRGMIKFLHGRRSQSDLRNAPFRFKPDNWFRFFEGHGWTVKEMRYLWDEGVKLNRPYELPYLIRLVSRLMSRKRREKYDHMSGYAMLVPR
jgi:methyltransferase (TIGR00027 family)